MTVYSHEPFFHKIVNNLFIKGKIMIIPRLSVNYASGCWPDWRNDPELQYLVTQQLLNIQHINPVKEVNCCFLVNKFIEFTQDMYL